jgi:hypothetical protein
MSAILNEASHQVHFYDGEAALLPPLVKYIGTALRLGHDAMVICRPSLADGLSVEIHREHVQRTPFGVGRGTLTVRDAQAMLDKFMIDGSPDPAAFNKHVGSIFETASAQGKTVVAYGEMVVLLCERGDFAAALRLEHAWNELLSRFRFSLLCAYPTKLFSNMKGQANYSHICAAHDRIYASGR